MNIERRERREMKRYQESELTNVVKILPIKRSHVVKIMTLLTAEYVQTLKDEGIIFNKKWISVIVLRQTIVIKSQ